MMLFLLKPSYVVNVEFVYDQSHALLCRVGRMGEGGWRHKIMRKP